MATKCGKQYHNEYCKNKICIEISAIELAKKLGIEIIHNPLSINPEDIE